MTTTIPTTTSTTRPSSPSIGDAYFETDTRRFIIYKGSSVWNEFFYDTEYDTTFVSNQLAYPNGLFTSSNYTITTQPEIHFDATILDGSDAGSNPSSGSSVSTWGNRSGAATNYDATQGTGANQPTYTESGGEKYVNFDGGDLLDFTGYTLSSAFTMVAVCNTDVDANSLIPIGTGTSGQYIMWEYGVNGRIYGISGSTIDNTYGPHYNSIQQFWATRDGSSNHNIYIQGGNSVVSATTSASRTANRIGNLYTTLYHTGRIYEIIIWGSDLSTTEKNTVRNYLNNKYSNLPTSTAFS